MENKVVRVIFPLFVGVLLALLIGFGILAVDPGPAELRGVASDQDILAFRAAQEAYSRDVSLAASAAAVVPLVVSLVLPRRAVVIANGLLLGALFTFLYAGGRGMSSRPTTASFAAAAVGLLVSLAAGHVRLAGWTLVRRKRGEELEARTIDDRMLAVVFPLGAGVLTAFAAALGIQAFYPQPVPPVLGPSLGFEESMSAWARGLGIIATIVAVVLLVLSMVLEAWAPMPGNALLLGGLFTLFYGVVPAMSFGQGATAFFVLAVALVVVLFVGYRRFVARGRSSGAAPKPPTAAAS